jgi:anthranilate phosphoribosyltransferase
LDEVTLADRTFVAETDRGKVTTFEIGPGDFGMERTTLDHLRGGDAAANAQTIREVLTGARRDAARSLVIANAAAALFVGGLCADLREAATLAANSIDSGAAQERLEELVIATNRS